MFSRRNALLNPILLLILGACGLETLVLLSLDKPWQIWLYNLGNLLLAIASLIVGLVLIIAPRFAVTWFADMLPFGIATGTEAKDESYPTELLILRVLGGVAVLLAVVVSYLAISGIFNSF
ncbi:MAG TPA: hypothetical protein VF498_14850 [Anaerolineales bacterium]